MQKKNVFQLFAALTNHGILFKQQRLRYTCVTYSTLSIT